jgi:hypothetical protein
MRKNDINKNITLLEEKDLKEKEVEGVEKEVVNEVNFVRMYM